MDALTFVRDDDNSSAKGDVATEVYVPGNCQMVELDDSRDLLEAFLELRDLLEVVTELNNGRGIEHTLRVDDELTVLERVDVALDEKQVRAALHGQEPTAGNVHTVGVVEMFDRVTSSSLKLDDSLAIIGGLRVDNDV